MPFGISVGLFLPFSLLSIHRGSGCSPFAYRIGVPCADVAYLPNNVSYYKRDGAYLKVKTAKLVGVIAVIHHVGNTCFLNSISDRSVETLDVCQMLFSVVLSTDLFPIPPNNVLDHCYQRSVSS